MKTEPLTVEELERFVREFIRENQPKPLTCIYCGEPATSGPMASGAIWFGQCGTSPTRSHSYEITLNTDPDAEVKRLIKFAESHSRQLWLEAAAQADQWVMSCKTDKRILSAFAGWLRAKAESTPKPSPALPKGEQL